MSLGALTTTFTPPTACTQSFENVYVVSGGVLAQGPLFSATGDSCFPNGYKPDRSSYFSPGFCAAGYTPVYSSSGIIAGNVQETTVVCCPSVSGQRFFYDTRREPFDFEQIFACKSEFESLTTRVTSIGDRTTLMVATSTFDGGAINAHGYQIRFQARDTLTPSSASIAPNPISTSPSSNTSVASPTNSPSSSGLSTGGAAAIGVVATILVIALVFAGFYFGRRSSRRRKRARLDAEREDANRPDGGNSMKTLVPNAGAVGQHSGHNLHDDAQKLYYSAAPLELGATPTVRELPTEHNGLIVGGQRRDAGPPPAELDTSRQY